MSPYLPPYLPPQLTAALLDGKKTPRGWEWLFARAYDAVQLAVALEVNRFHQAGGAAPVTLVSADQALNDAALAEGLAVDDPRSHP